MDTVRSSPFSHRLRKRQLKDNSTLAIALIVPRLDDFYQITKNVLNSTLEENKALDLPISYKIFPIFGDDESENVISSLKNISSLYTLVSVIGAGTMNTLELTALWTSTLNIPMCSGSFYDESFNPAVFPTFFQTSPSPGMFTNATLRLINEKGWKRISILLSNYKMFTSGTFVHEIFDQIDKTKYNISAFSDIYEVGGQETLEMRLNHISESQSSIILYLGAPSDYIDTLKQASKFGLVGDGYVWIVAYDTHYYLFRNGVENLSDSKLLDGTISVSASPGIGPRYERFLEYWNKSINSVSNFKLSPTPPETLTFNKTFREISPNPFISRTKTMEMLSKISVPGSFVGLDTSIGNISFENNVVEGTIYYSYYQNGQFIKFANLSKTGEFHAFAQNVYNGGRTKTPPDTIIFPVTGRFLGLAIGLPISLVILITSIVSFFLHRKYSKNQKRSDAQNPRSMQTLGQPKVDVQSNVKIATDILSKNRSKRTGKVGLTPYEVQFLLSVLTATPEDQYIPNFQALDDLDGGANAIDEETKTWVLSSVMASAPQKRANGSILNQSNLRSSLTKRHHGLQTLKEHPPPNTSSNWFRASNLVDADRPQAPGSLASNNEVSENSSQGNYSSLISSEQGRFDASNLNLSDQRLKSNFISTQPSIGLEIIETAQPIKDLEKIDHAGIEDYINLWYASWNFDMFYFSEITDGHPLYFTAVNMLHSKEMLMNLNINFDKFQRWILLMESEYHNHPYHNAIHAADVLHAVNYLLFDDPVISESYTPMEIFAGMIAAIGHDIDHPGLNNQFLVKSRDELAIMYSDVSVNEYHHIAHIFQTSIKSKYNIFADFTTEDYEEMRKTIIRLILATDMSKHFEYLTKFKTKLQQSNIAIGKLESQENRMVVLEIAMKCADLNNPSKTPELARKWTESIMEEFYRQGDREREMGLPISQFMDRSNSNVAKCQIGFIDILVAPLYDAWITFNGHNEKCLKLQREIGKNRNHWAGLSTSQQMFAQQQLQNIQSQNSSELNRRNSEAQRDGSDLKQSSTQASSSSMQRQQGPGSQHSVNTRKSKHHPPQNQSLTVSSGSWSSKKRNSWVSVKPAPMMRHGSKGECAEEINEDESIKA
ncbi:hypothetical protein HK098_003786 [Nowakowskiella sp. JEL0407]|nr:hypothetical protein HK098_003786 [Nowakowskiella sp. JEL0407]